MSQPRSQRSPITAYLNFTTPSLHGTPTPVPIHDARAGGEKALDTHGFTLVPFPQPVLSAPRQTTSPLRDSWRNWRWSRFPQTPQTYLGVTWLGITNSFVRPAPKTCRR